MLRKISKLAKDYKNITCYLKIGACLITKYNNFKIAMRKILQQSQVTGGNPDVHMPNLFKTDIQIKELIGTTLTGFISTFDGDSGLQIEENGT